MFKTLFSYTLRVRTNVCFLATAWQNCKGFLMACTEGRLGETKQQKKKKNPTLRFAVSTQKSFEFSVNAHSQQDRGGVPSTRGPRDKHTGQICLIDRVLLDKWQKNHTDAHLVLHSRVDAPICVMPLIQLTASVVLHEPLQRGPFHMQRCTCTGLEER